MAKPKLNISSVARNPWLRVALLGLIVVLAELWRLGSLPSGLNQADLTAVDQSHTFSQISSNPIYALHKLIHLGLSHAGLSSAWADRLPSVLLSLVLVASLYYVLCRWFGEFIALVGCLMAVTTPWFLLTSRSASPQVLLLFPLVTAAAILFLSRTKHHSTTLAIIFLSSVVALYQPAGLWFEIMIWVAGLRLIVVAAKKANPLVNAFWLSLSAILTAPLLWRVWQTPSLGKSLSGWPQHMPGILVFAKSLGWGLLAIVWRLPYHFDLALGRLPVLSVIEVVLLIFGIYAMGSLARTKAVFLASLFSIGWILNALNGEVMFIIVMLLPLFIFMVAGLRYLYFQWHGVFPYNPIPKFVAIAVISLVSILQVFYGLKYSLVAWPNNSDTGSVYHVTIKQ